MPWTSGNAQKSLGTSRSPAFSLGVILLMTRMKKIQSRGTLWKPAFGREKSEHYLLTQNFRRHRFHSNPEKLFRNGTFVSQNIIGNTWYNIFFLALKISSWWNKILSSQNFLFLAPKLEIWKISSNFRKIAYLGGSKTFFKYFFISPISSKMSSKISSKFPLFGTFSPKLHLFFVPLVPPKKKLYLCRPLSDIAQAQRQATETERPENRRSKHNRFFESEWE